jgi:hypothetical protein
VYYKVREQSKRGQMGCIMQDGSDQSKYRIVRVVETPKELEGAWCPRMKLLGSWAHGYVGCFWLLEEDVQRSGPDLTLEALMSTIEEVRRECVARGSEMPRHLWIQLDNTPAENKNKYVLQSLATLVNRNIFDTATAAFLRVGHTHEDLDGVWGVNQTVLGKSLAWDCPDDILALTHSVVSRLLKDRVVVERLDFVREWKCWGEPLDIKFQGIGNGPGAQHLYRFWRRSHVPMDLLKWVPLPEAGSAGLPGDVLLEVRQFMASAEPCQDFELVLRQGEADLLEGGPASLLPRRVLAPGALRLLQAFVRKLQVHFPERVRAVQYLCEWSTRSLTGGLTRPRTLGFLAGQPSVLQPASVWVPRPLATGELPARHVSVARLRKRRAVPEALPCFATWLARRQAQGVSIEQAKREWNGFALMRGLDPV